MKIKVMSDLHLNVDEFTTIKDTDFFDGVLVIAGDLFNVFQGHHFTSWALEKIASENKHVIYVLGNHEYYSSHREYYSNIVSIKEQMKNICEKLGIHLLDRSSVIIEGTQFVGCTLWSSLNNDDPLEGFNAMRLVNDFKLIKKDVYTQITTDDYIQMHKLDLNYLETSVLKDTVVVTHHLPSYSSIADEYKDSLVNGCFATELFELIYDKAPKLWIHGHTHTECDYNLANKIGQTRVLCRPCDLNGFVVEI